MLARSSIISSRRLACTRKFIAPPAPWGTRSGEIPGHTAARSRTREENITMETQTQQGVATATDTRTTWTIDPTHSRIGFAVKHMMVTTVHGRFRGVRGTIRVDD